MVLITASIMATSLTDITDIGRIAITDTGLTDISVGAAIITGVAVTAEAMAAGGMAGEAEVLTEAAPITGMVIMVEALAEAETLAVGGMAGAADTAAANTDVSGDVFIKDIL